MGSENLTKENENVTYNKLNDHVKIINVPVHLSQDASQQYGGKSKINLLILRLGEDLNKDTVEEIILGELPDCSEITMNSLKKLCSAESMQLCRLVDKDIEPEYKIKLINSSLDNIFQICQCELGLQLTQEGYDLFNGNDEYSKKDPIFSAQRTVKRDLETYDMEELSCPYTKAFRTKNEWDKTVSLNFNDKKVRYTSDELIELKNQELTGKNIGEFILANQYTIDEYIKEDAKLKEALENTEVSNRSIFYSGVVDRMLQEKINELNISSRKKSKAR